MLCMPRPKRYYWILQLCTSCQAWQAPEMKALLLATIALLHVSPCGGLDNGVAELPRMGWSCVDRHPFKNCSVRPRLRMPEVLLAAAAAAATAAAAAAALPPPPPPPPPPLLLLLLLLHVPHLTSKFTSSYYSIDLRTLTMQTTLAPRRRSGAGTTSATPSTRP